MEGKGDLSTAIGIISIAAVVHSHLCWFYSIIYIAYHKITPAEQQKQTKWKAHKGSAPLRLVCRPTTIHAAHSSPLIESQHKLSFTQCTSDMPILTETHLVSHEDSDGCYESVDSDKKNRSSLDGSFGKKRALGLIRSRFYRTQSMGDLETFVCSDHQCLEKKMRKRDTILSITRKFSDKLIEQQKRLDNKMQPTRTRLFRSLSSLKREKA
ncbi:hypothetical protein BD560DRAFT_388301 [Blakeslea trispora]|nr:hypothetical protein BD560DRAFT_388301 [Blakeslea trispora]